MSILIEGMQMPTEPMVLILFPDGNISTEEYEIGANAKAIEVPPHGRLIDADALLQHQWVSSDWDSGGVHEIVVSITDIDDAPTIIEAEGEEQREYEAQVEAAQHCEMYEPYDSDTGAM